MPTERRIRFTAEYDGSALPDGGEGYRTGTLGVHGSYFRDFGRGTAAVLHGQEAVVTARQAPDFAQRVLAETSGGARRDVVRMREDGSQTLLVSVLRALPMDIKLAIRPGRLKSGAGNPIDSVTGSGKAFPFMGIQRQIGSMRVRMRRRRFSLSSVIGSPLLGEVTSKHTLKPCV